MNNNKFLMQEYPQFKPNFDHRVILSEEDVKNLMLGRNTSFMSGRAGEGISQIEDSKQTKDLTYYIKTLVEKNIEQMLNFVQKIPFAVRAFLKILILRCRNVDDFSTKIKIKAEEIHMLSSFLIAGWLNHGYRNPKCFGI